MCVWILLILLKTENWKLKTIKKLLFELWLLFIYLIALFMFHEQCNRHWFKKKKKKWKHKCGGHGRANQTDAKLGKNLLQTLLQDLLQTLLGVSKWSCTTMVMCNAHDLRTPITLMACHLTLFAASPTIEIATNPSPIKFNQVERKK